jgi:hypothetical protein
MVQAVAVLAVNLMRRCTQHWKARVDHKVDWRSFEAGAVQHMARTRCVAWLCVEGTLPSRVASSLHTPGWRCRLLLRRKLHVLRLWHAEAFKRAMLLELLAALLQRRLLRTQRAALGAWQRFLAARVAKRMNALSALLQWEQSLTRRALQVWRHRTAAWRFK